MVEMYTPCFRIEIDGIDKTLNIWEYMESMQYDDAESGESDSLSFTVANDPPFSIPKPGAEIKFWLGWKESGMKYFGSFNVDECTINLNPATMSISAKSADFNSSAVGSKNEKERKDREWENISLAGIVDKIAAEHGYSSKVEVAVQYTYIAQTNESNLSFLRRIASEAGASFAVKDKTILIFPPDKSSRPRAVIQHSGAVSGSFTLKAREEYSEVEVKYWDKNTASEKKISSKRKKTPKYWETWDNGR